MNLQLPIVPSAKVLVYGQKLLRSRRYGKRGYSLGGVARTIGYSLVAGSDKLYSSWRALVCSEGGYTQFYAMKPKDVLPPQDQQGQ